MKKGWLIGIGVIVLVLIGYFLFGMRTYPGTSQNQSVPQENLSTSLTNVPNISSPPSSSITSQVEISNFAFNPQTVNIHVGDSVSWINKDSVLHKIASDSGSELNSDSLSNGGVYTHKFTSAGTYSYHCSIHTSMKGVVVVS